MKNTQCLLLALNDAKANWTPVTAGLCLPSPLSYASPKVSPRAVIKVGRPTGLIACVWSSLVRNDLSSGPSSSMDQVPSGLVGICLVAVVLKGDACISSDFPCFKQTTAKPRLWTCREFNGWPSQLSLTSFCCNVPVRSLHLSCNIWVPFRKIWMPASFNAFLVPACSESKCKSQLRAKCSKFRMKYVFARPT